MALTNIEYGSLASSETLNNNFSHLNNSITALANDTRTSIAGVNSTISTLNSSINSYIGNNNSTISTIQTNLSNVATKVNATCLYMTTYINGTSWYREYFSDAEKTTRVWIEQGGIATTNSGVTYLRPMSNTNYTITLGRLANYYECEGIISRTTTGFTLSNNKGWGYNCCFYVCGI